MIGKKDTNERLGFEVVGFRQWKVGPELDLCSASAVGGGWTPGINTARCRRQGKSCRSAPSKECVCGLYALHNPEDFWYGRQATDPLVQALSRSDVYVAGVVSAWGRIEVHHSGFRAEKARVVALALSGCKRDQAIARAVAAEYGVPVVTGENLAEVAAEYGSVVPSEMRPKKPKPGKEDVLQSQMQQLLAYQKLVDQRRRKHALWQQYYPSSGTAITRWDIRQWEGK